MFLQKIKVKLNMWKKFGKNLFVKPSVIFYYHRVAEVKEDPHLLSVSPENFERQILYLKNNFNIIKLGELVQGLKDDTLASGSVVITFDDGYADNFFYALPVLEKLHVPATIFITAGMIGSNKPFYWDIQTSEGDRGRAMTEEELISLAKSPMIEIGAHTMSHPRLAELAIDKQRYEIEESKKTLENILARPVIYFSYPFGGGGDFNAETMKIAEQAGFKAACATTRGTVQKNSPLFALPRRIVRNWNTGDFKKYIKNL